MTRLHSHKQTTHAYMCQHKPAASFLCCSSDILVCLQHDTALLELAEDWTTRHPLPENYVSKQSFGLICMERKVHCEGANLAAPGAFKQFEVRLKQQALFTHLLYQPLDG